MNINLVELCHKAQPLVKEVGKFILSQRDNVTDLQIEEKEQNSLVSYVDKGAEELLIIGLSDLLPDCGFITEEKTSVNEYKTYTWIIDPLDGTTNFLLSVPYFSVSVGLVLEGRSVLGLVYDIVNDEMFSAVEGQGAYLNDKKITVTNETKFEKVLIGTGFPYVSSQLKPAHLTVLKQILDETRGIRRIGSAAIDLCYVACGRFGAFYETDLNPWDVAAGGIIVQEAGGSIADFNNNNEWLQGHTVLASAPQFLPALFQKLQEFNK